MRKYLYIYKSEVMSSLQYTFNLLVGFISYLILIFVFLNLWNYMYSNPNEIINGYSKNQMIWYVVITEILWMTVGGRKLCKKICDDVRGGNIAYSLNKPYNYINYCLSTHLGDCTIKAIIFTILGILTGFIFIQSFPALTLPSLVMILIVSILAIIINILLIIFIGLISFYIEDANPFYWVYSKIILVLGTIFPIEYFPAFLRPILTYSPIYVVSYGPAKLFVDFSWDACLQIILAQGAYILIAYLLCYILYKKGVKKLNVNGG